MIINMNNYLCLNFRNVKKFKRAENYNFGKRKKLISLELVSLVHFDLMQATYFTVEFVLLLLLLMD